MKRTVVVDVDGVIAGEGEEPVYSDEANWDYSKCIVLEPGKRLLKALKKAGFEVILHTSRDTMSYPKNSHITFKWLQDNGFEGLYDCVVFNKPFAEMYIDDRGFRWGTYDFETSEVEEKVILASLTNSMLDKQTAIEHIRETFLQYFDVIGGSRHDLRMVISWLQTKLVQRELQRNKHERQKAQGSSLIQRRGK